MQGLQDKVSVNAGTDTLVDTPGSGDKWQLSIGCRAVLFALPISTCRTGGQRGAGIGAPLLKLGGRPGSPLARGRRICLSAGFPDSNDPGGVSDLITTAFRRDDGMRNVRAT